VNLVEEVRDAATASLRSCSHPEGLKASGRRVGHHQVWTRDTMIALLGGVFPQDQEILRALKASIAILGSHQTAAGAIPNNIDVSTLRPNFRAYADAGLWWIIGSSILMPDARTTERILAWYECQDVDRSGLLSMQESTDWQDLFCTRGKGLYLNCLYILALEAAARTCDNSAYRDRAERVRRLVNEFFWYRGDGNLLPHVRHTFSTESVHEQDSLGRKRWLPVKTALVNQRYYLPWLGFRACGEWFDSLGHMLAILAGVPDAEQTATILRFVSRCGLAERPMKSLVPYVQPGSPDWRDYYGMLNVPAHYHNGGVWPFIGGFWVAALVKCGMHEDAAEALDRLARLNRDGEFNEWHHGETGEPLGVHDQAWSAGMYLYAYECVKQGRVLHFT
jgi:hypothetical protein